jgi:hypothetical protein
VRFDGTVLALDIASTTGWACGWPGTKPFCGSIRLAKPGTSRAGVHRAFRLWLDKVWSDPLPDLIVYESPAAPMVMQGTTNIDTIKTLIGLAEHLEEWAYNRVTLREASVSQVRTHFIGRNMKSALAKPKTMQRCRDLGWTIANHDEADAAALWDYQCAFLRPDLAYKSMPLWGGG